MKTRSVWYADISRGRCGITKERIADMSVGKVIRKYRKMRQMTQEEIAGRLGVTASAVNKWEKENSCPDITLLAPIARLLNISLDTLLAFREDLTAEEISGLVSELDARMKEGSYDEAFLWAKKKLEEFPNCESLLMNFAVILDAQRLVRQLPDAPAQEIYLCSLYTRVLESGDEALRLRAADALAGFFMRKKQYEKAESYLQYFSVQNPEKKRKLAQIYGETGRTQEAYKTYEELLFEDYRRVSCELHGMYLLALQSGDRERARMLVAKQAETARCFEMGRYHEVFCELELAVLEKDADAVIAKMEEMLSSVGRVVEWRKAPLYEHMEVGEPRPEFLAELKENLRKCFWDEETYGFLKQDERWQRLLAE